MHRRGTGAGGRASVRNDSSSSPRSAAYNTTKRTSTGPPMPALLVAFLGALFLLLFAIWSLPNGETTTTDNNRGGTFSAETSTETSIKTQQQQQQQETTNIRRDDVHDVMSPESAAAKVVERIEKIDPLEPDQMYHMVFSTGCSIFQDWQSYMFFYHAMKVQQPGHVTRIVSGCNEQEEQQLRKVYEEQIKPMSPQKFHVHFTPDYSSVSKGFKFKYYNKPFGMLHWMEHGLGYPQDTSTDDYVVILMDPDQILLRPITRDFTNSTILWKRTNDNHPPKLVVEHGSPFGQMYGFGAQWKTKVDAKHVANGTTPVEDVTMPEARDYYSLGPPYIATARDMYKIVTKWAEFVPRVHDDYPHLLAEMFGYCFSAAHQGLKHQTAVSFMVSDIYSGGIEGWKLVDPIGRDKVCQHPPRDQLPYLIHYCQRYMLGKWFIGKYRLPKDFISCDSPMLMEPPSDIGIKYDYAIGPGSREKNKYSQEHFITRNAFMLCHLIPALNEAAEYYKQHHCSKNANYNKTLVFHKTMEIVEG